MPCFSPLTAWYSKTVNESGKCSLVFDGIKAFQQNLGDPINIGCGQCVGCRLERSRQWAVRCMHESQMFDGKNSFLTLTFDEPSLQKRDNPHSLDKVEFQKFMKRLRERFVPKNPFNPRSKYNGTDKEDEHKKNFDDWQYENGIRYYYCGEYGEQCKNCGLSKKLCERRGCGKFDSTFGRPHYHAIIFNLHFEDREPAKGVRSTTEKYYESAELQKLWPFGRAIIGDVTFESAAYVARYVMKKVNGKKKEEHYKKVTGFNPESGEIELRQIEPEYTDMSRRPGIGKRWFEKFKTDVYPSDFITVNGKKVPPPKYYDKLLELEDPVLLDKLKTNRAKNAEKHSDDLTPERLLVRSQIVGRRLDRLVRNLE